MSLWVQVLGGTVALAVLLGLTAITAFRIGCALLPAEADLLDRTGTAAMVGVAGWLVLLEILGLLGVLWLPVVVGCVAALALGSLRLIPASPRSRWDGSKFPTAVMVVAIPIAVLALTLTLSGPPTMGASFDSLHYHIVNAAHMLQTGSIRNLPFALPGDNTGAEPGDGTLLLLAVILPFHNASLVSFVDLFFIALLAALGAMLVRELGRHPWVGVIAVLTVVTTWSFFQSQVQSAYDDVIALDGLLAAAAFGLRAARTGEGRWMALAGAGVGLAIGTKEAYLLPGLVMALAVLWLDRSWRNPGRTGLLIAAAAGLSVAWYARNWVITGDPVFPATVSLGSTVLFHGLGGAAAYAAYDQSLVTAILGHGTSAATWGQLALMKLGALIVAPILCVAVAARGRGRARWMAIVALLCILTYVVTPFTGSVTVVEAAGDLRFLLPSVTLSVVALSVAMPERWLRLAAVATVGVNALLLVWFEAQFPAEDPLLVIAATLSVVILAAVHWRRPLVGLVRLPAVRRAPAVAAALLVILAVAHLQPSTITTPVDRALAASGNPRAPVVVMDVGGVTAILGPDLNVNIVAAGDGPVGAERPIRDAGQLTTRIEGLHPAAVVVSDEGLFDVIPAGWTPPPTWRKLGSEGGSTVYQPSAQGGR